MIMIRVTLPCARCCWRVRNWLGYRSCEPCDRKLKPIIRQIANTVRPRWRRSTDSIGSRFCTRLRPTQSGLSGTVRRIYSTSSAGSAPTMNMPRQPMLGSAMNSSDASR